MNKKLLVITGGNYIAGTEIVTLDVLSGLKKNGWFIHCIISGWNNRDFPTRLDELGITYSTLKLGWYYFRKILWSLDSLVHYPQAIIKFLSLRKKYPHRLLYVTSYRQLILLYPFLNKNILYHVHEVNSFSKKSIFLLKACDRKVLKYIAVSTFIKNDLLKCGIPDDKIEVIQNSVNPEQFDLKYKKAFDPKKIILGIAGQIIARKGHEDAIEALYLLICKGYKNIILHIVGIGDANFEKKLRTDIQKYKLENYVIWKGFMKEKKDIYKDIDILLAPTKNDEPFGMIAIEANLFAIPVIASNKGGFLEIIEDGYNGFLVNADSGLDISIKIEILLQNTDLIPMLGFNGRQKVLQQFTNDKMVKRLSTFINTL